MKKTNVLVHDPHRYDGTGGPISTENADPHHAKLNNMLLARILVPITMTLPYRDHFMWRFRNICLTNKKYFEIVTYNDRDTEVSS